jgi:hypothetical protein
MRTTTGLTEEHKNAMQRIRNSIVSADSIDDFISEWSEIPQLEAVAKIAISSQILAAERSSTLRFEGVPDALRTSHLRSFNSTWLGRIVRRPDRARRDINAMLEDVSFVVFNYDRLIEQYIIQYSKYALNISDADCDTIISNLNIEHAYGSLGSLTGHHQVGFGEKEHYVPRAAQSIRTYNEDHPSEGIEKVRNTISNSDTIIFLGCAYHEQNLDLILGVEDDRRRDRRIMGTALGVANRKLTRAIERLSKIGSVNFDKLSCSDYVRGVEDVMFN